MFLRIPQRTRATASRTLGVPLPIAQRSTARWTSTDRRPPANMSSSRSISSHPFLKMPFNITAIATASKGRADEVEKHLKAVKADVEANEPGTLKYITTRGVDDDHKFVIFEEYENVAAQEKHREGKPYNEFKKAIVETGLLDGGLDLTKTAEF